MRKRDDTPEPEQVDPGSNAPEPPKQSKWITISLFATIAAIATVIMLRPGGIKQKPVDVSLEQSPSLAPFNPIPKGADKETATVPKPTTERTVANEPAKVTAPQTPTATQVATVPPQQVAKATTPVSECATLKLKHESTDGHEDSEACLYHKNLISLGKHERPINPKSICIRVNGTPVAHRFLPGSDKSDAQIMIGPVAGYQATITASFCTGVKACNENCTIPKDTFLDAIGGGGAGDDFADERAPSVGWNKKNPSKEEQQLKRELAEIKKTLKDELKRGAVFQGWTLEEQTQVCGK